MTWRRWRGCCGELEQFSGFDSGGDRGRACEVFHFFGRSTAPGTRCPWYTAPMNRNLPAHRVTKAIVSACSLGFLVGCASPAQSWTEKPSSLTPEQTEAIKTRADQSAKIATAEGISQGMPVSELISEWGSPFLDSESPTTNTRILMFRADLGHAMFSVTVKAKDGQVTSWVKSQVKY